MKREKAGKQARRSLRGYWAQALAWEGALFCGTLGLVVLQGIAATALGIPPAVPTPGFVRAHPALLYVVAGVLMVDLFCLSPVRFGRTTFYVKRAAAPLQFALFEAEPSREAGSAPDSRHKKTVIRRLLKALRRLGRGGRYRRILAGRLLWWGWNGLGAALFLTVPAITFWLAATLPDSAAPYPLCLAILSWPLLVSGGMLWGMWSLRLSPLTVLLAAHPSWSVRVAARCAFRATSGKIGWLLRRYFGFLGWIIGCAAVISIAYVQPMIAIAQAGWFLSMAHEGKRKTLVQSETTLHEGAFGMKRRFILPATPAGQIPPRRGRAE